MIVMTMTRRNRIMIRASSRISDYLKCFPKISIDDAIDLYIQDHYYPEMDVGYRKRFLKLATVKYPPEFAIKVEIN